MVYENEVQMTSLFNHPMVNRKLKLFVSSFSVAYFFEMLTSFVFGQEWGEMSSSLAESTSSCRSPRSECRGHGGSPRAAQIEVA